MAYWKRTNRFLSLCLVAIVMGFHGRWTMELTGRSQREAHGMPPKERHWNWQRQRMEEFLQDEEKY